MGVYSEIAADLRDNVQDRSPTIQDAAELASRRADDRQQAEEEQAKALLSQMQQNADDSPSPSNLKADKKAEEDRKRQEHEQAEAKRKAEWEARQRAKEEAEQAAWENAVAMSDDEVMAASNPCIAANRRSFSNRCISGSPQKKSVSSHNSITSLCPSMGSSVRRAVEILLKYVLL